MSPSALFAQNPQILTCVVQEKNRGATLLVDSIGSSSLKFKLEGSKVESFCALKIRSFFNEETGLVPSMRFDFDRGACQPLLTSQQEKEIFEKLVLQIKLIDPKKPTGLAQWHRNFQPDTCELEKFNLSDLRLGAKRWQEGKWGLSKGTNKESTPVVRELRQQ